MIEYDRLLEIFQTYVCNDYEASESSEYVRDALYSAGLDDWDIKELGLSDVAGLDETEFGGARE